MTKSTKVIVLTLILFLIIGLSFVTYAWFFPDEIVGNRTNNVMVLTSIDYGSSTITYDNENNVISAGAIDLNDETAGSTLNYMLKFTIASSSTLSQNITIKWTNLVNEFCRYRDNNYDCTNDFEDTYVGDELTYALYSCTDTQYVAVTTSDDPDISSCTKISNPTNQVVPITGSTSNLQLQPKLVLAPNSTNYYIAMIYLENIETNQNYQQNKTFSGGIDVQYYNFKDNNNTLVNKILAAHPPVADNVASTYVSAASGIDFTTTNSPTNGQGLYINNKVNVLGDLTTGTVKYFRGGTYCAYTDYDIEDLNGTKCLAAGGTWTNNHCSLSDSQSACETAGGTYYELKNNVMFGGYAWKIMRINSDGSIRMIYNGNSPLAKGTNVNIGTASYDHTTSGTATSIELALNELSYTGGDTKNAIDTWYGINLSSYSSYLTDSTFCNDLTYTYDGTNYSFDSYNRAVSGTPSFNCGTSGTYSIANGNLSVPIATINVDEAIYSGTTIYGPKNTYYLQSGYGYWTMSPSNYDSGNNVLASGIASTSNVYTLGVSIHDIGVRPVISLKPEVLVSSGSGTLDDPWIVATS